MNSLRPTWAEIDLDAIAHNIREIRRCLQPGTKFMAVIKANAYGHGMVEVAQTCAGENCDFLAVAMLDEACILREHDICSPILILGYTPPEGHELVVESGFRQTIYDWDSALSLSDAAVAAGKHAHVHLKIDTGMARLGFVPDTEALETILKISQLPGLVIEGIFTHFAVADSRDKTFTQKQVEKYRDFLSQLEQAGLEIPIKHAANSAGIIAHHDAHFNMVRAGISIYGLQPSDEVDLRDLDLIPAMRLKSKVVMVKEVPENTPVSYGCTYVTNKKTRIATVPVGYGDGYIRAYSNRVWATVKGRKMPIIGRVCMDNCMFDATDIEDIAIGDEVILFGRPEDGITADDLAEIVNTINYEIVCLINSRVPRVHIEDGKRKS
ncbi:MAG: alanine racemase [Acidobacteriota bacterium]